MYLPLPWVVWISDQCHNLIMGWYVTSHTQSHGLKMVLEIKGIL